MGNIWSSGVAKKEWNKMERGPREKGAVRKSGPKYLFLFGNNKRGETMDLDKTLDLGYKWNRAAWRDRTNEIGCKVIKM